MIGVGVVDKTGLGIFGYDQKHDARPIPEEVDRLNVAGIVQAAGFIGGDENRGRILHIGVGHHGPHNIIEECVKHRRRRGARMAVDDVIRLDVRHRRERVVLHVGEE